MANIPEIQRAVAEAFRVPLKRLIGPCRERVYAWPRQVAYYLCRNYTSASFPNIGKHFGKRHHTTIMHGVEQVEKNLTRDRDILAALERRFDMPPTPPKNDSLIWQGRQL